MFHILNGDAVVETFKLTFPEQNYAVWREIHCQGPTVYEINSMDFINTRKKFLKDFLDISYNFYEEKTDSQLKKIRDHVHEEITIWFEYDLFCQVNMMAAINLIVQLNPDCKIFLITVGKSLDQPDWITLGHLKPAEWIALYQSRKIMDKKAIDFMKSAWKIYCSDDHREFDSLMTECPPVFKYFPQAIENHYRRFASKADGLTDIQRFIFERLDPLLFLEEETFVKELMVTFHYYGYGDLQYKAILRSLNHFVEVKDGRYRLKKKHTGFIAAEETQYLPVMIYGGLSNKEYCMEDFTEI